jgi:osmotically-inducible protein OsmY
MSVEVLVEMSCLLAFWLPRFCAAEVPPCASGKLRSEVQHQVSALSSFTVFDNISYAVNECRVTLTGSVTRPARKAEAEKAVKGIEGVERVENRIEVLPLSSVDNTLRLRVYRAIYEFPHLQKYAVGVSKPIRIIVRNSKVTLEGVVDCEADRDIAGFRAKGIADVISVKNNLRVSGPW